MWTTLYLNLPDAATWHALWEALPPDKPCVADVIGMLVHGGRKDVYGVDIEPSTTADGYHVNLRLQEGTDVPETLAAYIIATPLHPKRIFLGDTLP